MAIEKIEKLDRRYLWLTLIILLAIVTLRPLGLPIVVTARTLHFYNFVESTMPAGSKVIIGIEGGTGNIGDPTHWPGYIAVLKHFMARNFKLCFISTMTVDDAALMEQYMITHDLKDSFKDKVYGTDYVLIGWIGGMEPGMQKWGADPSGYKPLDFYGNPLADMPLFKGIKTASDFDGLLVSSMSVSEPDAWFRNIVVPFKLQTKTILTCPASVQGDFVNYVNSGQAVEVLAGTQAFAEYEKLENAPATGIATMDAVSIGIVFAIGCIFVGNIPDFTRRLRKENIPSKEVKEGM